MTPKISPSLNHISFERQGDTMLLNFGPQHPSAHGQLRLILTLDGERIIKADPNIGYLHRGIEKMAENMTYNEFAPITDRLDYISAAANNHAYALAVERLLGVTPPKRAQVIRMMILELNRIISHLFFIGVHGMDVGALSIFLYAFIKREHGLDLMESYCGARLTHNAVRIGGVPLDLPNDFCDKLIEFLDSLRETTDLIQGLLDENRIWKIRLENVGKISTELAKSWALSGVMARGSGLKYDIRRAFPYELYEQIDFDVPYSTDGDCYARYRLYMAETWESAKILRELVKIYPGTERELMSREARYFSPPKAEIMSQNYSLMRHFNLIAQGMRPPKGEIYSATESPRGELGFFVSSNGSPYANRMRVRAPSFYHTGVLKAVLPGQYLADAVTILGSANGVFGEIDR